MVSYELNKKLTFARQIGFIFNQINKLTKKNKVTYHIQIYDTIYNFVFHCVKDYFSENFFKILNIFKLFATIEKIVFISHVVNGCHIITHNFDMV